MRVPRVKGQRIDAWALLWLHDALFALHLYAAALWVLMRASWRWDHGAREDGTP